MGVPYARQIAVVVFLGLIALGSPSRSADSDFGSAPGSDLRNLRTTANESVIVDLMVFD
jgi:hypothetical protein